MATRVRWPASSHKRAQPSIWLLRMRERLFPFAPGLARGIARITLGLLFGFECGQSLRFLFLLPLDARGFRGCGFLLAPFLVGLLGLTRQARLLAAGGDRRTLGPALGNL